MTDNTSTEAISNGTKRIQELVTLNKLTGKEEMLIDNGEETLKVTVDSLLGYIAKSINAGQYPSSVTESSAVVVIPEGENLPAASRVEGNIYYRVCSTKEANLSAGYSTRIKVSPNMGLRLVAD